MKTNYQSTDVCYLCGDELSTLEINRDHVFPQQFIEHRQPKKKGFDYAGFLYVHKKCNAAFGAGGQGPESICKKALQLIEYFGGGNYEIIVRVDNPEIVLGHIDSSKFPNFTDHDLKYFKLIDGRNVPVNQLSAEDYFRNKERVNPIRISMNIALSTLAKSAGGLIVKRHEYPCLGGWRIMAVPYFGGSSNFTLDGVFGYSKPFGTDIKFWVKPYNTRWICAYKYKRVIVCLAFESYPGSMFSAMKQKFHSAKCYYYDSTKLLELINYDWFNNEYQK